jgi:hypothetical protein
LIDASPGHIQSLLPTTGTPRKSVMCDVCAMWETPHRYSQELYRPVERKRA